MSHPVLARTTRAFFFPSSREILLSTIRRFVPFSFPSPLLFPLRLIFLSRALDFLPREPFGLLHPRHISPCRSGESAFRSNKLLFPELLCTRDAPSRQPRRSCSCSCMQLRGCNLRTTSNNARAVAGECCPGFLSALSPPPPPRPPVLPPPLRPAIVLRECFARLRFSRAWLSGMHPVSRSVAGQRRLSRYFCLRWKLDNSIVRYAL